MDETKEISRTTIQEVADKLKKLDKQWAKLLAEIIAKKEKITISETKIYNIVNGGLNHQVFRQYFMKHSASLLESLSLNKPSKKLTEPQIGQAGQGSKMFVIQTPVV